MSVGYKYSSAFLAKGKETGELYLQPRYVTRTLSGSRTICARPLSNNSRQRLPRCYDFSHLHGIQVRWQHAGVTSRNQQKAQGKAWHGQFSVPSSSIPTRCSTSPWRLWFIIKDTHVNWRGMAYITASVYEN